MIHDYANNVRHCVAQYANSDSLTVDEESDVSARIMDSSTTKFFGKINIQPESVRNVTFHHLEHGLYSSSTDYMLPDVSTIHELMNHHIGKALFLNFMYEIAARRLSISQSRES